MKKVLLFFTFLLITQFTHGQNYHERDSSSVTFVGFQTGITTSWMQGIYLGFFGNNYKGNGLDIAFRLKHEFNPWIYVKSGLGYYQKQGYAGPSRQNYSFSGPFSSIQIPINIGFQPVNFNNNNNNKINIGLESGITLNHIPNADDKFRTISQDVEDKINWVVPSLNIGINLEVLLSESFTTFVNYQYSRDLTPTYNLKRVVSGQTLDIDYDLRFSTFSVSIGVMFLIDR